MTEILYKYLDADGGLLMLKNHNLQFTNATQLNDPFDCHPSLIDYSNACTREAEVWGKKLVEEVETGNAKNRRDDSWICSLSKNNNSMLMWSYYGNHKGICIGLNREKTKACLSKIMHSNFIGAFEMEVQYKDIVEKPDYFRDRLDFLKYQLSTKAIDWAHEQEVRFLLIDPWPASVPHHPAFVDYIGTHVFHDLNPDCFETLYFGGKVDEKTRKEIIKVAKKLNPNIKFYRMRLDPLAFRLKAVLIEP
ncbi:MAG: DUF2971 domain-containing protein [Bacteroidales bacterium]|nr:DUF2971 domain-containing protein [Bacteroidales bacterium]